MKKLFMTCFTALLVLAVSAEDKQTVKINGAVIDKTVQSITFDGDNANLLFTDGTSETADMELVVMAFEYTSGVSIIKIDKEGNEKRIYDINGRQVRSTLKSLPTGIYIVKTGDKSIKYIKR